MHRLVEALDAYDTGGGGGDEFAAGDRDGFGGGLDSLDDGAAYGDYDEDYDHDDGGFGGLMGGKGGGGGGGGKRYREVSSDEDEGVEYVPAPYTADGTVPE
jgi:hypothetical protein